MENRLARKLPEGEKGTGAICAKHPPGRSGKLHLSPFSHEIAAKKPQAISALGFVFFLHRDGMYEPYGRRFESANNNKASRFRRDVIFLLYLATAGRSSEADGRSCPNSVLLGRRKLIQEFFGRPDRVNRWREGAAIPSARTRPPRQSIRLLHRQDAGRSPIGTAHVADI
jgi:hypothetical protein